MEKIITLDNPIIDRLIEVIIELETPTPEEYLALRKICGLAPRSKIGAEIGLPRSLFCTCLRLKADNNVSTNRADLIGMGRIIGDLGCFVQICDIAVHPKYQGRGLSHIIMQHVMEFIKNNVDKQAFVNLFADVDFLYEKYGFVKAKNSVGMYLSKK